MLVLLAHHGGLDLTVRASGDLDVDGHHTVEDIGLALGQALREALGEKRGIRRYGSFLLPMDEALAMVALVSPGDPISPTTSSSPACASASSTPTSRRTSSALWPRRAA